MYVPCEVEQRLKIHGREKLLAIVVLKLSNRRQPILLVDETKVVESSTRKAACNWGCRKLISPYDRSAVFPQGRGYFSRKPSPGWIKGGSPPHVVSTRVEATVGCKRSDIFARRTAACSITGEEGPATWSKLSLPTCSIFLSLLAGKFPRFSSFFPQTFAHWSRHWPSAWQRHEILRQRSCRSQL